MASEKKETRTQSISPRKLQQLLVVVLVSFLLLFIPKPVEMTSSPEPVVVDTESRLIYLPPPANIPIKTGVEPLPAFTARGVIVYDPLSNITLYENNADLHLLPASTTKMMTAIVAMEHYDLDQVITITEEERTIGNTMHLNRGEQLSVRNLLSGLLISSANDAALALALAYPNTGYSGFISAMNEKARELGLKNTNFRNVSGVESLNHYSSARDLAFLAKYALKNKLFKEIVSTQSTLIPSTSQTPSRVLKNTNALLGSVDGVFGVKTGWTENAGECLVTAVERDGQTLIIVVLGSQDRFGESQSLLEWAFNNYTWKDPLERIKS